MISVQPLTINYSFASNRTQATDKVNLAQLDAAFSQINAKLTEIIAAMDATTRDDDTLHDNNVEPRHLSTEIYSELIAMVNGTSTYP